MKLANTTRSMPYDIESCEMRLTQLKNAGFRYIDFSFYNMVSDDHYLMGNSWKDYAYRIKEKAEKLGLEFVQAHTPGTSGNALEYDEKREMLIKTTQRSIEVCKILGIENSVIHTGWKKGVDKDEYFEKNKQFLSEFFPYMEEYGVNILVENSTKRNMPEMYFFYTGEDMKQFIDYVSHPLIHACWDIGHAHIEGHQYEDIMTLGDDLRAIHVHDNCADYDSHSLLFSGTINMDEIMHGLIDSGYKGYFTFECDGAFPIITPEWKKRKTFRDETRLLETPAFLFEELDRMMYKTGKYILEKYNIFED